MADSEELTACAGWDDSSQQLPHEAQQPGASFADSPVDCAVVGAVAQLRDRPTKLIQTML